MNIFDFFAFFNGNPSSPKKSSANRKNRRSLRIEELESREMLSATPWSTLDDSNVPMIPAQVESETLIVQSYDSSSSPAPSAASSIQAGAPYGSTSDSTSEYMIGSVYVSLVLMESDGKIDANTTNWTNTQIDHVKSEVTAGLQWWEDTFDNYNPNSQIGLDFTLDTTWADDPFETSYEPIKRSSEDEPYWVGEYLVSQGYTGEYSTDTQEHLSSLQSFNNDQRNEHDTDWAVTIFVVNSRDANNNHINGGLFTNGRFAYAWLGGPSVIITYDCNGWGSDHMETVIAHEVTHSFWALDEYPGSGCFYTDTSGYYDTQNTNVADGHPNSSSRVASIMAEGDLQEQAYSSHTSSTPSLEMIGWRDKDGDGILDVLDEPMNLAGSGHYDSSANTFNFTGTSSVAVLPSKNTGGWIWTRESITLNTVDKLQYQLDDGAWETLATDYGGDVNVNVSADVSLASINDDEEHTITFRTLCERTGVFSAEQAFTFSLSNPSDQIWLDNFLAEHSHLDESIARWENGRIISLDLEDKGLTGTLDVSPLTALKSLQCGVNQLTSLDVSGCTALETLGCRFIQLTSLDVSNNTALTSLSCNSNDLTTLDVSNNTALTSLSCDFNGLTTLDVSNNTALTSLQCRVNQLTSLDVSGCTALIHLWYDGNELTFSRLILPPQTIAMTDYSPQATVPIALMGNTVDLTEESLNGNTTFTWYDADGSQIDSSFYTENEGQFTFADSLGGKDIYAKMSNEQFPGLTLTTSTVTLALTPLAVPTVIAEVNGSSGINVGWQAVANASGYTVEWSTSEDFSNSNTKSLQVTEHYAALTGLTAGTIYYIRVKATGSGGYSDFGYSEVKEVKTPTISLAAPTGLTAEEAASDSIALSWDDVTYADGYVLEMSTDNLTFSSVYEGNAAEYISTGLSANTTYFFRVKATGSGGYSDSGYSEVKEVKTPTISLAKPENLAVSEVTSDSIALSWDEVTYADGYILEMSTDNLTFSSVYEGNAAEYISTGLSANTTYYFRVKAVGLDEYSDSEYSTVLSAATLPPALEAGYNANDWMRLKALGLTDDEIIDPTIAGWEMFETELRLFELDISERELSGSLNLTGCSKLYFLDGSGNAFTELIVDGCTALQTINCDNNQLTALDVSQNSALQVLNIHNNQLTALDVSQNSALQVLNVHNNQLTALDVSGLAALTTLSCRQNQLLTLNVADCPALKTLLCENNPLKFSSLPLIGSNDYEDYAYIPQYLVTIPSECDSYDLIDLSSEYMIEGLETSTLYRWFYADGTEIINTEENIYYTEDGGIFNFTHLEVDDEIYCEMTQAGFPDLVLTTTIMTMVDLTADAPPESPEGLQAVDAWNPSTRTYTVTLSWNRTDNAESFDIQWKKASDTDWTSSTGTALSELSAVIAGLDADTQYEFQVRAVNRLGESGWADISLTTGLAYNTHDWEKLDVFLTEPQILDESIVVWTAVENERRLTTLHVSARELTGTLDLAGCDELLELYCGNNQLTALDLTDCVALEYLECSANQLSALDVSQKAALNYLDCGNNQLTILDVSGSTMLEVLYCANNQFTTLDVSNNKALESLDSSSNLLKFSTLPKVDFSDHIYAPQQLVSITAGSHKTIDLSSEYLQGKTVYTWYDGDGALIDSSLYTAEAGVFAFAGLENGSTIYCIMTNADFPELTLETTKIAIGEENISSFECNVVGGENMITITWEGERPDGRFQYRLEGAGQWITWYAPASNDSIGGESPITITGLKSGAYEVQYIETNKKVTAVKQAAVTERTDSADHLAAVKPKAAVLKKDPATKVTLTTIDSLTLILKQSVKEINTGKYNPNAVYEIAYWDSKTPKVNKQIPDTAKTRIAVTAEQLIAGVKIDGLNAGKSYAFEITAKTIRGVAHTSATGTAGKVTAVKGSTLKYTAVKKAKLSAGTPSGLGEATFGWTASKNNIAGSDWMIGLYNAGTKQYYFAEGIYDVKTKTFISGTSSLPEDISIVLDSPNKRATVTGLGSQKYTFGVLEYVVKDHHMIVSEIAKFSVAPAKYAAVKMVGKPIVASGKVEINLKAPSSLIPPSGAAISYEVGIFDKSSKTYVFGEKSGLTMIPPLDDLKIEVDTTGKPVGKYQLGIREVMRDGLGNLIAASAITKVMVPL